MHFKLDLVHYPSTGQMCPEFGLCSVVAIRLADCKTTGAIMRNKKPKSKIETDFAGINKSDFINVEKIFEEQNDKQVAVSDVSGKSSKLKTIINLMSREGGACLEEMIEVTNWQKHSIRGAISGGIKKKLGLNVQSRITGNVRSYFIETPTNSVEA